MRRRLAALALPALPFALAVLAAEALTRSGAVPTYLFPAPTQVWRALTQDSRELWSAARDTGLAALAGLLGSLAVGVLTGVALASSSWLKRVFYPYAVFFQTVPIISIAPLLVIWLGYGWPTIVASSFIVSVFPVVASTLTGLLSTEPALVDLFRLYRAGPVARLLKLRIPFALPSILTGARIASGLAVIGAIVGEFIAGGGLGGVVDEARKQQRVDLVFAAVLLASLLGLAFFAAINLASRLLLRHWHHSEKN
jgi:NitT/TauT family transport system permease protein